MKGKTLLTTIAVAFVALLAASGASALRVSHDFTLTLKAPPEAQVSTTVNLTGMLAQSFDDNYRGGGHHVVPVANARVKLFTSTSPSCNKGQVKVAETRTDNHGLYGASFAPTSPGQLWVQAMAFIDEQGIDSPCLPLNVTTLPVSAPHENGSFLCYSVGGAPYYAATEELAESLMAAGYWLPTAVAGSTDGGINIGSTNADHSQYHLVCKAPGASADTYTNHEGDQLSGDFATGTGSSDGFYPIG
jgi:hypothetical protein